MGSKAAILIAILVGCGGSTSKAGDAHASDSASDSGVTITAIAIAPATVDVPLGTIEHLVATATRSDGSMIDVTATATWQSSMPSVATADGGRLVTASVGTTTVTATMSGVSGSSSVGVHAATLVTANYTSPPAVEYFAGSAQGNVGPTTSIAGNNTTLMTAAGLAIDGHDVFVADPNAHAIAVFDIAGGNNVAPVRRIAGANTLLSHPNAVAVSNGELFVGQDGGLLVFPATANGNVAPTRTVQGVDTELQNVMALAIDGGELYAASVPASGNTGLIAVFPTTATGDVAPTRAASATGLYPMGLWVQDGQVFATSSPVPTGAPGVWVYPASANMTITPTQVITGAATTLSTPLGVVALGSEIYIANYETGSILVFPATATGNVAPGRAISGTNTTLVFPYGLTVF